MEKEHWGKSPLFKVIKFILHGIAGTASLLLGYFSVLMVIALLFGWVILPLAAGTAGYPEVIWAWGQKLDAMVLHFLNDFSFFRYAFQYFFDAPASWILLGMSYLGYTVMSLVAKYSSIPWEN